MRWYKKNNHILLRSVSFNAVANDSLPIYQSVESNHYAPILKSFKIKTYAPDSTSAIIDATELFTTDIPSLSALTSDMRMEYKVKKLDNERSFIESARSFPINIEVKHEMTYIADAAPSYTETGSISLLMNQSMILLPQEPMTPRLYDQRVGWFTVDQVDYGSTALKADKKTYIKRWKLTPKDPEAYFRGELVEPEKPIVYYLDPATPYQWRKYFKQGIEDWQKVFETAGFKNAILAKDPPTAEEDPDFSPEDARYSIVRYVASTTRNAMGPSVADPRSGEIIESDIIWYHNHLRSYRNRYLIETGAANPKARTLDTPEEEIGEMIRMVIAHEVGHALGLPHNMKASAAYAVDSLRSGSFTQKYGIAASIMDYARYNYVAQPGDSNIRFVRQIGPYDHYSINWGYRVIPNTYTAEQETPMLNEWIRANSQDRRFHFGDGYSRIDPDAQTENIGDNAVKASSYGLDNLKIVAENLLEWTTAPENDYSNLTEIYGELIGVWSRYIGHVTVNIGGVRQTLKNYDQPGVIYTTVDKETQKRSIQFLIDEAFTTPQWLLNQGIIHRIRHSGHIETIRRLQVSHLYQLLSFETLQRLIEAEALNPKESFTAIDMLQALQKGLWQEVYTHKPIDAFRRTLQKAYIERLEFLLHGQPTRDQDNSHNVNSSEPKIKQSDIPALARAQLLEVKRLIDGKKSRDKITQYHLDYLSAQIKAILDPKN